MIFYTYVWYDPRNGNPIYVGKGKQRNHHGLFTRANRVLNNKMHDDTLLLRSVCKKIEEAGLIVIVKIEAIYNSEVKAFASEKKLITQFGRRDLETGTLCNLTDGGEGASGKVLSEEECIRISKRALKRWKDSSVNVSRR